MKRLLTFLLLLSVSTGAFAQLSGKAQITTRKEKLSDFTAKVTKVVLTGNDFFDAGFKDALKDAWRLSPYECCTHDDFAAIRKDGRNYFLMVVQTTARGETRPRISMLTLVKGDAAELGAMTEVVTLPLCAADSPSGREAIYLPALLDVMQQVVEKALVNPMATVAGQVQPLAKARGMKVFFDEEDLSAQIDGKLRAKMLQRNVYTVASNETEDILMGGGDNTLVSYVVAPAEPEKGSVCYKMLLDARTYELYYFAKHKITASKGPGFLRSDVGKILSGR